MKLKNKIFSTVITFTFLLLASYSSFGQTNTNSNTKHSSYSSNGSHKNHCSNISLNKEINLTDFDSEKREIKINVAKNTTRVSLNVNCHIETGGLTIEIYNSKGKKQSNFSVEGSSKSKYKKGKGEPAHGQINLNTSSPTEGDWIIKVIPKQAIGKIQICSTQNVNN